MKAFFLLFALAGLLFAQTESGSKFQPRKLIDMHTAGALPRGCYELDFKFFAEGGLSTFVGVGLTNRFSIGIAYAMTGVIGNTDIRGQSFPGGFIKYRLMEESYYLPGLAIGFDSEGAGKFYKKFEKIGDNTYFPRFYFKSKGLFGVLSKSYLLLGQPLGLHAEVNYSAVDNQAETEGALDGAPSNRVLNGSIGIDKSINDELSLMCEYDLGLDDNHDRNPFHGYLNACVRWAVVKSFVLEIDFKDLLENKDVQGTHPGLMREMRIVYVDKF
ncbi:MAG: hypothetical protein V1913_13035 [Fibrobacterota bacterium]